MTSRMRQCQVSGDSLAGVDWGWKFAKYPFQISEIIFLTRWRSCKYHLSNNKKKKCIFELRDHKRNLDTAFTVRGKFPLVDKFCKINCDEQDN